MKRATRSQGIRKAFLYIFLFSLLPLVGAQNAGSQKLTIELITPSPQPTPNQYQQNDHILITHSGKLPTKDDLVDAMTKGKKVGLNIDLSTANMTLNHMIRIFSFNTTGVNMSQTNRTIYWYAIGIYDPTTNTTFMTTYQDNGNNALIWYGGMWTPVLEQFNMFTSPPPSSGRTQKMIQAPQRIFFFD
ncbi:MAG: hypothetical protein AABW64_00485 [Nanoarchaeota archaeon]